MKRFALVALVAAMVFSLATSVSATELKVRGNLDVYGMWSANLKDFDSDKGDPDNYMTTQRMRAYFDYVANENLKAVLGFELDTVWGEGDADWGGDLNSNELEVKHAYIDFVFPDSTVHVQAGLQYVALPSVFGNPVFDDDAAAITVDAKINDMFSVVVGYTRGTDKNYNTSGASLSWNGTALAADDFSTSDDKDMAFMAVPVSMDGFNIAPYFAYAWIGENAGFLDKEKAGTVTSEIFWPGASWDITTTTPKGWTEDATVWVLGANAELTMFDPLTIAADLIYGQLDGEIANEDYDSDGWYAALAASYKFDMLTATLFTTYFSGADKDADKDNYLPTLSEGWGLTPYIGGIRAFSGSFDTFAGINADMNNASWVTGLKLTKIQFIDKLSHDLTIAYAKGTSDEEVGVTFDEEDSAWEVYMVNKYMIYENLAAINELGFFAPNFDDRDEDNSYFATVGLKYSF